MNTVLMWLIPPLVGAVIGYVTNDIAIKMLFRPLEKKKFLGIPIPFTPGILPRQRHKLADNIGRMVERELLTEESIRKRLRAEDFRSAVERSFSAYTEGILSVPLKDLALPLPALPSADVAAADGVADASAEPGKAIQGSDVARIISSAIKNFIASPGFREIIAPAVAAAASGLSRKSLRELMGKDPEALERLMEDLFGKGMADSSDFLADQAASVADAYYPQLSRTLLGFLNQGKVRSTMEIQGRIFLSAAILKLNVLQRFFISAGQYDKTLRERMPEIIDDSIVQLAAMLEDQDNREQIISLLRESVRQILREKNTAPGLVRMLKNLMDPYFDKPLGELVPLLTGKSLETLAEDAAGAVVALVSEKSENDTILIIDGFLRVLGTKSLGAIFSVTPRGKEKLDRFATDRLLAVADEQVASALKTINIRSLVSERIDSLNMERVERIVLDVMSDQFRWINLFGALLGAIIGLFQAALAAILR